MNGKAKWVRVSWMAGALLPLVAGITGAANTNSTQPPTNQLHQQNQQAATSPEQTPQFQPKLERAKDLIGSKVVNDKDEHLGTIKDVVLTSNRDGIDYVVLARDSGTWGVGEKYFAVPWSQLSIRPDQKLVVLSGVSKADLDRAPGFDKDHWPATARANWLGIEPTSGMTPSEHAAAPAPSEQGMATTPESRAARAVPMTDIQQFRLTKLFGTDIRNPQGENLGKLDNVMIDLNQGRLAYGIMSIRSGFLGLNKDFAAVPWTALNWTAQPGIARLDTDKQTLESMAFSRDNFPDLSNLQYSRQLYERFHVTPYWEGQNLGYIPGEATPNINPPSSAETKAPNSGMTAPNKAPNAAAKEEKSANHTEKHALSYNPSTVETIHGKVTSVGSYRIEGTSVHGVLLHVKTEAGKTLRVQVGPRPFLDSQNINFRAGDPLTITGSMVKAGHHEILLASQIQMANRTLDLRAPDGKPLWNLEQYQTPATASKGYNEHGNSY
jgi:sporulation protein YlmC with PRC-barrel domain